MIAVERVLDYSDLPSEAASEEESVIVVKSQVSNFSAVKKLHFNEFMMRSVLY
jgi:hypothetical protein